MDLEQRILVVAAVLATMTACGHGGSPGSTPLVPDAPTVQSVAEAWVSPLVARDNVDSVAVADREDWVIATTKGTHQLLVLDAATGDEVRRVGSKGSEPGQFRRPNGIAVVGSTVLVVERDNHRVQVLALPTFESLGFIGADHLQRPYGIAAAAGSGTSIDIWVTDNYDWDRTDPQGHEALARRVRRYSATIDDGRLQWQLTTTFGDTTGRGALWKVETIAVDPERGRLLIADEEESRMALLVYSLDGRFSGTVVGDGVFRAEPEGVGLWRDGDRGVWVATDQHDRRSVFHLFDRDSLAHLGAFSGATTANTDGIAVTAVASSRFPLGAVYAVHDDRGVSAFDWRNVADLLPADGAGRR
jgi:3-phytase